MAAMSTICSSGLVGVSIQTSLVAGVMDRAKARGAGILGVARDEAPGLEDALEQPVRAAVEVGRGDDFVAGPEQREHGGGGRQARGERQACSPPSRAARHVSRAARVGLPLREYS